MAKQIIFVMANNLKYPVFVFRKKDNMVYVFYDDKQMKTTNIEIFKKTHFEGRTIVDSPGMKYTVISSHITRYWGFWEGLFQKGRTVSFEYDYKDAGIPVTLNELKGNDNG